MYPCPGNWVAIGHAVVYYARVAQAFSAGIKFRHCMLSICNQEIDSMQHMFQNCEVSKALWAEVNNWIVELGMIDYNLSNMKIIVGDFENALAINTFILITKKVIYAGMKKEQKRTYVMSKMMSRTFIIRKNIDIT